MYRYQKAAAQKIAIKIPNIRIYLRTKQSTQQTTIMMKKITRYTVSSSFVIVTGIISQTFLAFDLLLSFRISMVVSLSFLKRWRFLFWARISSFTFIAGCLRARDCSFFEGGVRVVDSYSFFGDGWSWDAESD